MEGGCEYTEMLSWTAEMVWSSSLGVGRGAYCNKIVTKYYKGSRTRRATLDKQHKLRKMSVSFDTWNVSSLCRTESLSAVSKDISK
jgi:hypothetical protein